MEEHKVPDNLKKCFAKLKLLKDDLRMLSKARPEDREVNNLFKFFDTFMNFEGETNE